MIYQKSCNSGILPQDCRNGHVIPFLKKRDAEKLQTSKSTSVVVKLFESVIRDVMMEYLLTGQQDNRTPLVSGQVYCEACYGGT